MAKKKSAQAKLDQAKAIAEAAAKAAKEAQEAEEAKKLLVPPVVEPEPPKVKFVPAKRPPKQIAPPVPPSPLAVRAEAAKASITKTAVRKVMTAVIPGMATKPLAKKNEKKTPAKRGGE